MDKKLREDVLKVLKHKEGKGRFKQGVFEMIAEKTEKHKKGGYSVGTIRYIMNAYENYTTSTFQTKDKIWEAAREVANYISDKDRKYKAT